jgi:hypothetical protein
MTANPRVVGALGGIGALLVEREAKVGLNDIWKILDGLDRAAFAAGYGQGQADMDSAESYRRESERECRD